MVRLIRVTLLGFDGGFASTQVGPVEILRLAGVADRVIGGRRGRPRFRAAVASLSGAAIDCGTGLWVKADKTFDPDEPADVLFLASGGPELFERTDWEAAVLPALRQAHARGTVIVSLCAGVFALARAGLLNGRRATTHWAYAARLAREYPLADVRASQMITDDGNVICGGGVNAATDLALYLVERFCGHDEARALANALVLDRPRAAQSGYANWGRSDGHGDAAVAGAQAVIADAPESSLTVDGLARQLGLTPRTLARRFKAATGETVIEYVQRLRVALARELLERERLSVETVARRVGYEDVAFFRRLFRKHTGSTPSAHRQRVRPRVA